MRYFGGKQRIAKQLAACMQRAVDSRGVYIEPFVGGGSVLASIQAPLRIAGDANTALISMWEALAEGWKPPDDVSEEEYRIFDMLRDPTDPMTAFCGFGCSFAGKWFGGYARGGTGRNYATNAASSLRRKMRTLADVIWYVGDYQSCPLLPGAVIYCDPPYAGTTGYETEFDSTQFWAWCQDRHNDGYAIFVSEYDAPDGFVPALTINTRTDIRTKANGKEERIERLFVPEGADYILPEAAL